MDGFQNRRPSYLLNAPAITQSLFLLRKPAQSRAQNVYCPTQMAASKRKKNSIHLQKPIKWPCTTQGVTTVGFEEDVVVKVGNCHGLGVTCYPELYIPSLPPVDRPQPNHDNQTEPRDPSKDSETAKYFEHSFHFPLPFILSLYEC
jgi:hypothetical protein